MDKTLEERAREISNRLSSVWFTHTMIQAMADAEEAAACKKCGRVIFCGAKTLCSDTECELQHRKNSK